MLFAGHRIRKRNGRPMWRRRAHDALGPRTVAQPLHRARDVLWCPVPLLSFAPHDATSSFFHVEGTQGLHLPVAGERDARNVPAQSATHKPFQHRRQAQSEVFRGSRSRKFFLPLAQTVLLQMKAFVFRAPSRTLLELDLGLDLPLWHRTVFGFGAVREADIVRGPRALRVDDSEYVPDGGRIVTRVCTQAAVLAVQPLLQGYVFLRK